MFEMAVKILEIAGKIGLTERIIPRDPVVFQDVIMRWGDKIHPD
jgi:hypothetical protein